MSLSTKNLVPSHCGFGLVGLATLVWGLAHVLYVEVIEEFVAPAVLWFMLLAVYGWRQASHALIPIAFLYLAIPFWDYFAHPLQLLTVAVNHLGFLITGIEAEIEGVFVELPGIGTFEVAHGCSGLRYLIVGLTLTTLFGYLNYSRWRSRLALVALGVVLSLIANWIRVFGIIYVGYKTRMQSSLIEDHEMFGWVVFAITLIPLFWVANRMAVKEQMPAPAQRLASYRSYGPVGAISVVVILAAVVLLPSQALLAPRNGQSTAASRVQLPGSVDGWRLVPVHVPSEWAPVVNGYTKQVIAQYYNKDSDAVAVNLFLFEKQSPGRELVQDSNRLADFDRWKIISAAENLMAGDVAVNSYVVESRSSGKKLAIVHGYYVAGLTVADRIKAKLFQSYSFFSGRYDASSFFLSATCRQDCEREKEMLSELSPRLGKQILASIDEAYLSD